MIKLYTTGTPTAVTLLDLGAMYLVHPVSGITISDSFSSDELKRSVSLQSAITYNQIYLTDESGNTITDVSKYTGSLDLYGSILPATDGAFNLGSATKQWESLYVSSSTIYIQNTPLSVVYDPQTSAQTLAFNDNTVVVNTNTAETYDLSQYVLNTTYNGHTGATNPHGTTFSSLNSKPTTISGFGITDAYTTAQTYTSSQVDNLLTGVTVNMSGYYTTAQTYNTGQTYTKTEVNNLLTGSTFNAALYYTTAQTYTKTEVNNLITGVTVDLSGYYTTAQTYNTGQTYTRTESDLRYGARFYTTSATTTNTTSVIQSITGIPTGRTSIIEVYVTAWNSAGTYGSWKRSLVTYHSGSSMNIMHTNADLDKFNSTLKANNISFTVNSSNIDIYITGISGTNLNWESFYEIKTIR